ncbi:reverse transcriptase domain-containing protein [Tanacetum coccineum]
MDLQIKLETTTKNHQASIQNVEAKFDRFADKQSARPSGSLPSITKPNSKGSSSKPYHPPQAQNEHVNAVFTQSGKSYDPPINPTDQQNDSETPINFDSEDEEEESTPQPKSQTSTPIKETLIPKPYKPKIPYPRHLRKEKMEAQNDKFLDMIRAVRINVPLVDVGKFTFLVDFVILEMEEDSKVPLIFGRPFLQPADAVIRVKQKQLNLGVGSGYQQKDRKPSQNDKTEHGMEKTVQNQGQTHPHLSPQPIAPITLYPGKSLNPSTPMNGEMKRRQREGLGLLWITSTLTASTSQQKEKAESLYKKKEDQPKF